MVRIGADVNTGGGAWLEIASAADTGLAEPIARLDGAALYTEAPACRHATTWERPCWPGPWTSTLVPNPTPQSNRAHSIPLDNGVAIPAFRLNEG